VLEYITHIAAATRVAPEIALGASVRGALSLVRCSKTWAASRGRHYVIPDDVKELAEPVLAHRMVLDAEAEFEGGTTAASLQRILGEIAPPAQRSDS